MFSGCVTDRPGFASRLRHGFPRTAPHRRAHFPVCGALRAYSLESLDGHGWFRTSDLSRVKSGLEGPKKGLKAAFPSGMRHLPPPIF